MAARHPGTKVANQPQTMMFPPLCFEVLLLLCSSFKDSPKYVTFQLTSYQQIRQHLHIPVANIYLLENYYEKFYITNYNKDKNKLKQKQKILVVILNPQNLILINVA